MSRLSSRSGSVTDSQHNNESVEGRKILIAATPFVGLITSGMIACQTRLAQTTAAACCPKSLTVS